MDDFSKVLTDAPQELILFWGGLMVCGLTYVSRKILRRWNYDIDPKVIAAGISVLGGISYTVILEVASDDFLEGMMKFWVLAFSGSIAIHELYKSIVKKPVSKANKSFPEKELELRDSSLLYALVEVERKARILNIDFEEFSLELIKRGKLTENDLVIHVFSLNERIKIELEKKGESFLSEGGI